MRQLSDCGNDAATLREGLRSIVEEELLRDGSAPLEKTDPRRRHATAADRQRAYRERTQVLLAQVQELKEALTLACGRGRSCRLTNHLPEAPGEWVPELTRRLNESKIIVAKKGAR